MHYDYTKSSISIIIYQHMIKIYPYLWHILPINIHYLYQSVISQWLIKLDSFIPWSNSIWTFAFRIIKFDTNSIRSREAWVWVHWNVRAVEWNEPLQKEKRFMKNMNKPHDICMRYGVVINSKDIPYWPVTCENFEGRFRFESLKF